MRICENNQAVLKQLWETMRLPRVDAYTGYVMLV